MLAVDPAELMRTVKEALIGPGHRYRRERELDDFFLPPARRPHLHGIPSWAGVQRGG